MEMDLLRPGQSAYITKVNGDGALRHHLLDMGLTPGTEVTLQKIAPMGDPVQIEVRGYELTLRLDEAKKIEMTEPMRSSRYRRKRKNDIHPFRIPVWVSLEKQKATGTTKTEPRFQRGQSLPLLWREIRTVARLRYLIS